MRTRYLFAHGYLEPPISLLTPTSSYRPSKASAANMNVLWEGREEASRGLRPPLSSPPPPSFLVHQTSYAQGRNSLLTPLSLPPPLSLRRRQLLLFLGGGENDGKTFAGPFFGTEERKGKEGLVGGEEEEQGEEDSRRVLFFPPCMR